MKEFIYNLIPSDHFITRKELIEKTGMSDRSIREYISELKKGKTIISNCNRKGYKRGIGTNELKSVEELDQELELVKKAIKEINSRKKVYNFQLRQYIAYMKVLEKKKEEFNNE